MKISFKLTINFSIINFDEIKKLLVKIKTTEKEKESAEVIKLERRFTLGFLKCCNRDLMCDS